MDILAWRTHLAQRDKFLESAVREVSKHGDLNSHALDYRELADGLTTPEVVWLYERLRESRRLEFEWRGEFLALFPQVRDADLPPPLVPESEEWQQVFGPPGPCVADESLPF